MRSYVLKLIGLIIVLSSYGKTLPQTDASPSTDQYKWVDETTPATKVAQWRSSYANGRLGPISIAAGATTAPLSVWIPNGDPQVIVLYSSRSNVVASLAYGSTVISVTSPTSNAALGIISSVGNFPGSMSASLTVKNNSTSTATGVIAVVLSRSRFLSDWETARRGDIIQMYGSAGLSGPHTTFIQTNYNANGSTSATYNWLDSNWSETADGIVRAHNVSMETMMLWMAKDVNYGFTLYRLN